MSEELIYLASPYTARSAALRQWRFRAAAWYASQLMRAGRLVFSPIAHGHPITEYGVPGDWEYWGRHSTVMLGLSRKMVVLKLNGWRESAGVGAEIEIAMAAGLPIEWHDWPAEAGELCVGEEPGDGAPGICRDVAVLGRWLMYGDHSDRCMACHCPQGKAPDLRGHQIHHLIGGSGRSHEPCNLSLLCGRCHGQYHAGGERQDEERLPALTLGMLLWAKAETSEWDAKRLAALRGKALPHLAPLDKWYLRQWEKWDA